MRVRLIKKFAEKIDGIDLTGRAVGDLLNLKPKDARLLIAEQWAMPGGDPAETKGLQASASDQHRDDQSSATTVSRRRP